MNAKRRGLGKGLDALLGSAAKPADRDTAPEGDYREMPVDLIQPGRYQPRTGMDPEKLQELADSIQAQGMVQPIVVRQVSGDQYEIIAGERRWRAAQIAGLSEVPVVVRDVPDQATVAMALIENIQREDLNPLEESGAIKRLIEEFELTHEEAARAVGRSRVSVSNLLRLQELEEPVKKLVDERSLEMGHARALLGLTGSEQVQAARRVALRGLSVRETEALVRRWLKPPKTSTGKTQTDPNIVKLEQDLTEKLCARVQLKHKNSGKGQLVVSYNSLDELDGILERLALQ
ncbi:MAG: ParB/RepB/Spo0J family partition protein [Xanthomonadales bacterium]|nr:ParB/RepB/Spo0J family partition protein [Xanthomonadales bacterium]